MREFFTALYGLTTFLVALSSLRLAGAATVAWLPASGTNDWFTGTNWSGGSVPTNGDDVVVANNNVGVLLTNSTAALSSILLSNRCALVFSNWNTCLSATNVAIQTNAVITLPAAFKSDAMSNRVWIICSNLTLGSGCSINADGRGYLSGNGPGSPYQTGNELAGSYGGWGGGIYNRGPYGSAEAPFDPGSGGTTNNTAAQGGGAVRIDANGTVAINGIISANGNGASGNYTGGGSGGGIYIACRTLSGAGGVARANGGSHGGNSGAGGGGRIAVIYDGAAQSNEPTPSITFSTQPGSGSYQGDIGTLYFSDNQFLTNTIRHIGRWMAPGFTNWIISSLTISNNASISFPADGFLLNVTGDLTITGSARLFLGGNDFRASSSDPYYSSVATSPPILRVGGNLIITNSAQLHVFSGNTNATRDYGALIDVAGDVLIAGGSVIYLYSRQVDADSGASALLIARNVVVDGTLSAKGRGYRYRLGPGKGASTSSGAGYGGLGGYSGGGPTYGSSNAPMLPGSGGGNGGPSIYPYAAGGGGLARIEAQNIWLNGSINANGNSGYGNLQGGASGGGIFIICDRFEGGGALSAAGGNTGGFLGGGGGGRIAVWFDVKDIETIKQKLKYDPAYIAKPAANLPLFTGAVSVAGGAGGSASYNGTNGTIMFIQGPALGTVLTIH